MTHSHSFPFPFPSYCVVEDQPAQTFRSYRNFLLWFSWPFFLSNFPFLVFPIAQMYACISGVVLFYLWFFHDDTFGIASVYVCFLSHSHYIEVAFQGWLLEQGSVFGDILSYPVLPSTIQSFIACFLLCLVLCYIYICVLYMYLCMYVLLELVNLISLLHRHFRIWGH